MVMANKTSSALQFAHRSRHQSPYFEWKSPSTTSPPGSESPKKILRTSQQCPFLFENRSITWMDNDNESTSTSSISIAGSFQSNREVVGRGTP
jgi:hypothetical protein